MEEKWFQWEFAWQDGEEEGETTHKKATRGGV